jgi:predicted amidohydrolase YtcJ
MHVFEGTIIDCTEAGKTARFLVEAGGRIRFVGDKLPVEFAAVPRTQLGKRALIPAFADSHLHFVSFAFMQELDLRDADTIGAQLEILAAYHAHCPH